MNQIFKYLLLLVIASSIFIQCKKEKKSARTDDSQSKNYIAVSLNDSRAEIIEKAANVTPSPQQLDWQKMELTAFMHFGINTFTDREWGDGTENPEIFDPKELDASQWVKTCKEAGMKLIILTAKHHDGFCLWPSDYTEHSVKNSPWKNGKGDVMAELAMACREQGMKLGVYLSPWDRNNGLYGTEAYNDYFVNQLTELLTNYGDVAEVWFDGANGEGPNGQKQIYDWQRYYQTIRTLQPQAVIAIMGPDIRWVGTESGYGRDTEWSVVPESVQDEDKIAATSQQQQGTFRPKLDFQSKDIGSVEKLIEADRLIWYPSEVDVSIRPGWFYHKNEKAKSVEKLLDIYYSSVGKNSVLLLNIPPDTRGLIDENDAKILKEWRQKINETFKNNLAEKSIIRINGNKVKKAKMMFDGNFDTYWMANIDTPSLEIKLDGEKTFDRLLLQEQITVGQRVENFRFEAKVDGHWKSIAQGTTIGYKRLLRFPRVTTSILRLTIVKSRAKPTIAEFGIYDSGTK